MLSLMLATQVSTIHVRAGQSIDAAVRALASRPGRRELHLHGRFEVSSPIVLDGVSDLTIVGHDRATLSGGTTIHAREWTHATFQGHDAYRAAFTSTAVVHEAWSEGRRLHRPTLPATGFYNFGGFLDGSEKAEWNKGQSHMRIAPNTIANWKNLSDVELVAHHLWITSRLPIKSVSDGVVEFTKPAVFKLADDYTGGAAPFRAENVAEAFGGRDEFYVDRANKCIYVTGATWPDRPRDLTIPVASQVLQMRNCRNVTVRDVEISNTEWDYPDGVSGDGQAAISVPGAVEVSSSKGCAFERCRFRTLGTYGIEFNSGSVGGSVVRCDLTDLGGGGVKIASGTKHTTVEQCVIAGGGRLHAPAIGVWIADSGENVIRRNLISDFLYTGISIGWVWGYGPSNGNHNLIEGNVIHTIGQRELSDMGAIYNLGVSPGTVIRRNLIADVQSRGYGGWGIYLDEGSTDVVVEQNAVFGVRTGTFHQHYGRDNLIQHNLLCGAERDGQIIRSRREDHVSFNLNENVILWSGTSLFGGTPSGGGLVSRNNLLARSDAKEDVPDFDKGSRRLASGDASTVSGWLGAEPGSRAWWDQFGPGRGGWRRDIEPFVNPWLQKLKSRLSAN